MQHINKILSVEKILVSKYSQSKTCNTTKKEFLKINRFLLRSWAKIKRNLANFKKKKKDFIDWIAKAMK